MPVHSGHILRLEMTVNKVLGLHFWKITKQTRWMRRKRGERKRRKINSLEQREINRR